MREPPRWFDGVAVLGAAMIHAVDVVGVHGVVSRDGGWTWEYSSAGIQEHHPATCVAISEIVINQDETKAAATRNMTMLVLSAAETKTS